MYTPSKAFKNITLGIVLLFNTITAFGQQANVVTTVTPPNDVPFDQLKSQLMVMVTNTSGTTF